MPAPPVRTAIGTRALLRSRTTGLVLTCCLVWCACGKEPELPQKPAATYGIPQQRPTNTSTTPPSNSPDTNSYAPNRDPGTRPRFDEPREVAPEQTAPPADKARNYSAELADILGKSAPSCLGSFRPSARTAITIQVSAQAMASGRVSRADAQATGLTPPILACIKKLAGTVQLRGPIDDAPRNVQTQLTLQTQGSPDALQPKAATENTDDDARDGDPRDSKIHPVEDDTREVPQKLDEPTREAPEPPDPPDQAPTDNHTDEQP